MSNVNAKTKKSLAATVIRQDARRKSPRRRKDLITLISEKAGLSVAGSATYLQNFRSGKWAL